MTESRLVWDIPTRVFHWSLALNFLGAYLTGESERWALVHITSGYSCLGLILFRLLWGIIGSRYARFSGFVPKPKTLLNYIAGMFNRRPAHYVGHNPLGALGVLGLLLLGLSCTISGWMVYDSVVAEWHWLETVHEATAEWMLVLVFIHIAGVAITSYLHRENLVKAMLDGKKQIAEDQAIAKPRPLIALLIVIGILVFWLWSFRESLFS